MCSSSRYPASWEGVGCVLCALIQPWVWAPASVFFTANSPEQLQAGNTGRSTWKHVFPVCPGHASLAERAETGSDPWPKHRIDGTSSTTHPAGILYAGVSNGMFCPAVVNAMEVRFSKGSVPLGLALHWQNERKCLKLKLFRPMFTSGNSSFLF